MTRRLNAELPEEVLYPQYVSRLIRQRESATLLLDSTSFFDRQVTSFLSKEEAPSVDPYSYLRLILQYGENKVFGKRREILDNFFKQPDFNVDEVVSNVRDVDLRTLEIAKINNLYYSCAQNGKYECSLDKEDLNKSLQQALVQLQNKDKKKYVDQHDHLQHLLQLNNLPVSLVNDNQALIKETVNVIFSDIIPEKLLPMKLQEAFRLRNSRNERTY